MQTLQQIIHTLQEKDEVVAVLLTGSLGDGTATKNSDIDLIIILKDNSQNIESIFTWIDGVFADIYFFDLENIKKVSEMAWIPENISEAKHKMTPLLYDWLKKGEIRFDKSGELTKLKSIQKDIKISQEKQWESWVNTNYNFETNSRYFNANDSKYHEALEIRLLYSVVKLMTTYFDFINMPWRGEKNAITYLKEHDNDFYQNFIQYTKSASLDEKFKNYSSMTRHVFELNQKYPLWQKDEIIPRSQKGEFEINNNLVEFWKKLSK